MLAGAGRVRGVWGAHLLRARCRRPFAHAVPLGAHHENSMAGRGIVRMSTMSRGNLASASRVRCVGAAPRCGRVGLA